MHDCWIYILFRYEIMMVMLKFVSADYRTYLHPVENRLPTFDSRNTLKDPARRFFPMIVFSFTIEWLDQ